LQAAVLECPRFTLNLHGCLSHSRLPPSLPFAGGESHLPKMKKVFTLITVLITLSLIGMIVIQVSWIKGMVLIKKEQVREQLNHAMFEIVEELAEEKGRLGGMLPSVSDPEWPRDPIMKLVRPPSIAQQHTVMDIQRRLRRSFEKHGQPNTKFECAVIAPNEGFGFDLLSPGFERKYEEAKTDTLNNWVAIWPIIAQSGSDAESLSNEERLVVVISSPQESILRSLGPMIAGAVVFTLVIIAAFFLTVRTLLRQKKLSEMKSDFINNMTHELKTPLATISLAVDAIRNDKVMADKEKISYFSGIIKDENNRMNKQVETILQSALLDKEDIQVKQQPIHVHDILEAITDNFELQLKERNAHVELALEASNDVVEADELHFTNMLSNLFDNAVKYSRPDVPPEIRVSTQDIGTGIRIGIQDNGIGMNKETVSRIFERFYRAHTGNVHNVKGFGLGLSYVKSVVDAHQGTIRVDSSPGKGTLFTVDVPVMSKSKTASRRPPET
jgi:two-component system phosphate regulon sensor histidine kinase PhoR